MIDYPSFEDLVKDIAANLYDTIALEAHPLISTVIKPPPGFHGSRGDYIRQLVLESIEQLQPERKGLNPGAPEWRPYLILRKRYADGVSTQELAASLAVSDRQLRRDQHRALQALSAVLWRKLFPTGEAAEEGQSQDFEPRAEPVDLKETLEGIARILKPRLVEQGASLVIEAASPLLVNSDRVILRQILLSLFNWALHMSPGRVIRVRARSENGQVVVAVEAPLAKEAGEIEPLPETAQYWAGRIQARLEGPQRMSEPGRDFVRREIALPRYQEQSVLVLDDQSAAVNLFRRLFSQTPYSIYGTNRPMEALPLARQLQPVLIILDVMMPQMDGWEVLQTLKLDEKTRDIPVLICSAWEEPELSRSLGAAGFLKKPVTLKSLQEALKNLGL